MKFYDKATITIKAGKGGDGLVSGRREKYMPYGGPAGGDGGNGGDVILKASENVNTLIKFRYKRQYKCLPGENGMSNDKFGKSQEDITLTVPVGTVVKNADTGQVLFQLLKDKQEYVVARGGRGGWGNKHFVTSSNQYPEFALLGEEGEKKNILLELQLLGDVALIGTPSVGKSSIINSVSNTKVKVADYPFTTLIPNLGIVKYNDLSFSIVDIPGLIKGASLGKGLGNEFLRHILKARVFAFVIDISRFEKGMLDFEALFQEIVDYIKHRFLGSEEHGQKINNLIFEISCKDSNIVFDVKVQYDDDEQYILRKVVCFVLNKYDMLDDAELLLEYKKQLLDKIAAKLKEYILEKDGNIEKVIEDNSFVIAAATNYNLDLLIKNIVKKLDAIEFLGINDVEEIQYILDDKEYIKDITETENDYLLEAGYITKSDFKFVKIWEIKYKEFVYWTYILPWGNEEAEMRFWKKMEKEGFVKMFEKEGIVRGDILKVSSVYGGDEVKYIVWD